MSEFALNPAEPERFISLYNLAERNRLAEQKIVSYATGHAALDVGIGIVGTFVPGGGLAALGFALIAQAPIYQSLAWDLGRIYSAPPDQVTDSIVSGGVLMGSAGMVAAEFATEFFTEIAGELLTEVGLGAIGAAIPLIGGLIAAGLDAAIAATMTWRVGSMVSLYFQNGQRWLGSRHSTYERAKELTGGLSPAVAGRVSLNDIPRHVAEVFENQVQAAIVMVRMIRKASPESGPDAIREALLSERLPEPVIEEAIRRISNKAA